MSPFLFCKRSVIIAISAHTLNACPPINSEWQEYQVHNGTFRH